MLEKLIGYQIMEMNEGGFTVRKDDDVKHFIFDEDCGGCCGYNDLFTNLLITPNDTENNPFITRVEYNREENNGDHLTLTFFGADKALATIGSHSFSGSGWCYGACVNVRCVETKEEETLTEW